MIKTENKNIISSGSMTGKLVGYYIAWSLLFGTIAYIINNVAIGLIENMVFRFIIAVVVEIISCIIIWKFATKSSFKYKTISYFDMSKVIKNLAIIVLIVGIINFAYSYISFNYTVKQEIEENSKLNLYENLIYNYATDDQLEEYNREKQEAIDLAITQGNKYIISLHIVLIVVDLCILLVEKKFMFEYVDCTPDYQSDQFINM